MRMASYYLLYLLILLPGRPNVAAQPGFISLDCGGTKSYTDATNNISWVPDTGYVFNGSPASLSMHTGSQPLQNLREFTNNQTKNCYSLPANVSTRYLIRATFLYGNYDGALTNPIFALSLDATTWATVTIANSSFTYFEEIIASAQSSNFSVCLLNKEQGTPFISTLELRPITGGIYGLSYMNEAYLSYKVRINYGAPSAAAVRYPDDPVDRIWVSDQAGSAQAGDLLNLSDRIMRNSTSHSIDISLAEDQPPAAVMQTAVIGTQGLLSYRYHLDYFPNEAYAVTYFAEIQQLRPTDIRSFSFSINANDSTFVDQPLNINQAVGGSFIAFEASYSNVTLPEYVEFSLVKDSSSTLNPLLNAQEIYEILPKVTPTYNQDVASLTGFTSQLALEESQGDPCLPLPWDWVTCNSATPPRVITITLSGKNITGSIPSGLSAMTALQSMQLQNNQLSGQFPQWLADLPNLTEIWVENNQLTGTVPRSLLGKSGLNIRYEGNPNLCASTSCSQSSRSDVNVAAVVGSIAAGAFLFILGALALFFFVRRHQKSATGGSTKTSLIAGPSSQTHTSGRFSSFDEVLAPPDVPPVDQAHYFQLAELKEATMNFSQKIGEGGFGPVFYGKTKDNQEIAVKLLAGDSRQGVREFFNEVNLLSRVHHRNLVALIGYCHDVKERMLVYEFMPNGTLFDHLHGPPAITKPLDWIPRLNLALDAAKGLEYLHTGCNPSIIHRDVKSSNILLTNKMVAKVSDFGMSKLTNDESSPISGTVQGTVGYLDPEYDQSQQLTRKSDVYSFGVVLLELISGRGPLSSQHNPPGFSIVNWARSLLQKGDLEAIVDPALGNNYSIQAMWKVAELAILSVEPLSYHRPDITEVVKGITEAIQLETYKYTNRSSQFHSKAPSPSTLAPPSLSPGSLDGHAPYPLASTNSSENFVKPSAR